MKCGDCKFYYTKDCPREPAISKGGKCVYANSFKDYSCERFEKKMDYREIEIEKLNNENNALYKNNNVKIVEEVPSYDTFKQIRKHLRFLRRII